MNCLFVIYSLVVFTIVCNCSSQLQSNLYVKDYKCMTQRVLHMSLLRKRVFLSILNAFGQGPTFLETQWIYNNNNNFSQCIANDRAPISQAFPHLSQHQILNDPCYPNNCNLIQQARWSQIDNRHNSRLWLLDVGRRESSFVPITYNCPSKLIIFNIEQKLPSEEKVILYRSILI